MLIPVRGVILLGKNTDTEVGQVNAVLDVANNNELGDRPERMPFIRNKENAVSPCTEPACWSALV